MFTGIIRAMGVIKAVEPSAQSTLLTLSTPLSPTLREGDSVAVQGVCLTVLSVSDQTWQARLMQETLSRTNLGMLQAGDAVNLERPLRMGDALDGHIVQGHVDGVCTIEDISSAGDDRVFTFRPPQETLPYLIPKGCVALDGVSLTVVDVANDVFTVSMMPYTLAHTTFGKRSLGAHVNMEADMLGKYAVHILERYARR